MKHKAGNMIEEMTDNMLADLIEEHEYVAVYFRGDCENSKYKHSSLNPLHARFSVKVF